MSRRGSPPFHGRKGYDAAMALNKDQVLDQLRRVQDPQQLGDIVSAGMVSHAAVCDGVVSVTLRLPPEAADSREAIRGVVERAVYDLGDAVRQVQVDFEVALPAGKAVQPASASPDNPLPGVAHVIAVGAGKGGVGKSTVAVNLAVALTRAGQRVGLLDGDVYGPSLPTMLGLNDAKPQGQGKMILPFEAHGLKTMTIGVLVEEDKPLIWRGPMAQSAFKQLATQTAWGELDTLVIDLPPGTGDVPLTMAQMMPLTGAVVVCTPQKVAQDDARRAVGMFRSLGVEVLGVVENMSYFIGDDGKEYDLFGKGGAELMARQMGVPFLGSVPINTALRRNSDAGDPRKNFDDEQLGQAFTHIAEQVRQQVAVAKLEQPELTVR